MRRWRIRRWKDRPAITQEIAFTCVNGCWKESLLKLGTGLVEAQLWMGIIYDPANPVKSIPQEIECPHCRRIFELEERKRR